MKTNIFNEPPEVIDISERYLFYLHGLIVEEAGVRPKSEEHGYYEYQKILEALAQEGFIVLSEARSKGTDIKLYAEKIVPQVKSLLENGVPPSQITIVGASKGGIITAYISSLLKEREINYVFLAGLFEKCLVDETLKLYGNVLSIHDRSDKASITPSSYFERSKGLGNFKEIVLSLDKGHGLIYKPYQEWINPLLDWVKQR